jgi:hypothetical protein
MALKRKSRSEVLMVVGWIGLAVVGGWAQDIRDQAKAKDQFGDLIVTPKVFAGPPGYGVVVLQNGRVSSRVMYF